MGITKMGQAYNLGLYPTHNILVSLRRRHMNPPPPTPCYLPEYLSSFGTNTNLEYSMKKAARSEPTASSLYESNCDFIVFNHYILKFSKIKNWDAKRETSNYFNYSTPLRQNLKRYYGTYVEVHGNIYFVLYHGSRPWVVKPLVTPSS